MCCALGDIKPIGTAFNNRATDDFIAMVEGEDMFAKILKIDTIVSWHGISLRGQLFVRFFKTI